MFGINKNGTKHKTGIIMPAFYPASRVTYDGGTVADELGASLSTAGLTFTDCSYKSGGYAVIGNLVVVNMRITNDNNSNVSVIEGFPTYSGSYNHVVMSAVNGSTNALVLASMARTGALSILNNSGNVDTIISGSYIKG